MSSCPECRKILTNKTRCSCGWTFDGGKKQRSPRHGLCEYNDHGIYCGQAGAIALQTGEGGPWYCSNHALGLKGMKPKKIGQMQNIAAHLKPLLAQDSEAKLERDAIQSEARE